MKKNVRLITMVLAAFSLSGMFGPAAQTRAAADRTGFQFLDRLVALMVKAVAPGVGLGTIADAVMSEVVSLHIHLETLAKRTGILKGYLERGMNAASGGKGSK